MTEKETTNLKQETKKREIYFDVLRIIACLMVIFAHTNDRGYSRYAVDGEGLGSALWIADTVIAASCKTSIYIFFMISGALLLRKQESLLKTYRRSIRILIDLFLFSSIYLWLGCKSTGIPFVPARLFTYILSTDYWHLWYLYAYIALIITLPFLRDFAQGLTLSNWKIMYVLAFFITAVLPFIEANQEINSNLKPSWITVNILLYPISGYILDQKVDIENVTGRKMLKLWGLSLICLIISLFAEYHFLLSHPGDGNQVYLNLAILSNVPIFFLTAKYLSHKARLSERMRKMISGIGSLTFGIYLFHLMIMYDTPVLSDFFVEHIETGAIGSQLGVYLTVLLVFVICGVITWILRKVPLVRRLF